MTYTHHQSEERSHEWKLRAKGVAVEWKYPSGISNGNTARPVSEFAALAALCWITDEATSSGEAEEWMGADPLVECEAKVDCEVLEDEQTATSVNWEDPGVVGWAGRTVANRGETLSAFFATSVSN